MPWQLLTAHDGGSIQASPAGRQQAQPCLSCTRPSGCQPESHCLGGTAGPRKLLALPATAVPALRMLAGCSLPRPAQRNRLLIHALCSSLLTCCLLPRCGAWWTKRWFPWCASATEWRPPCASSCASSSEPSSPRTMVGAVHCSIILHSCWPRLVAAGDLNGVLSVAGHALRQAGRSLEWNSARGR